MLQVQALCDVGRGIKIPLDLMVHASRYIPHGTPHNTHLTVHTNYNNQAVGAKDQLKAVLVT